MLVSCLAEGADRLAAHVALQLGFRLVVPLPMPVELYEKDFAEEGTRREFADLLAKAEHVFEVGYVNGNTAELVVKTVRAIRRRLPGHAA